MSSSPVVTPDQLTDALGAWTERSGPRYRRLAAAIRGAIEQGLVPAGARLPAERALADGLLVSRTTVVNAYALLRDESLVESRRGSGTTVRAVGPAEAPPAAFRAPMMSQLVDSRSARIDLSIGAPVNPALVAEPLDLEAAVALAPPHGFTPLGLTALRQAVAAKHAGDGVPTAVDEVMITSGAQGALSLVARGLVTPGDRVVVEAPTYPGALEAFSRAGALVESIPMDEAGARPDALERALARGGVRLVYLVPTCHNPTGAITTEARRRELVYVARRHEVTILEDGTLADVRFAGPAPTPLAALAPELVLAVGSLSKIGWGGLRVGWLRAPSATILRLARMRAADDLGGPVFAEAVGLRLLERLPELIDARCEEAESRMRVLADGLRELLPAWEFTAPRGGFCLWVRLPHGSGDEFAQVALRHGVAVAVGSATAIDDDFIDRIRLSYTPSPERLRGGVERLARAWAEYAGWPAAGTAAEPALPL